MISQTLTIARTTFLESVRQPIYFVLLCLAGLSMVFVTWSTGFSMDYGSSGEVSADNRFMLQIGLASIFLLGTVMAGFVATSAVSREIERRTVLTVVSKPVPRPVLILGKYVGVAAAMAIAVITMLVFMQLAIRHGVQSTAADDVDQPVVVFAFSGAAIALFIAIWGNFFYGWSFTQTFSLLLCPLTILAWVLVLLVSKKWEFQSPVKDFKPQVLTVSICVGLAILVLTAVAIAASARLGQVMTIVVCLIVMVVGLLSSPLFGRQSYLNDPIAAVLRAEPERERMADFRTLGDTWYVTLKTAPSRTFGVGDSFYYGPYPNGFDLQSGDFEPRVRPSPGAPTAEASATDAELTGPGAPVGLVVTAVKDLTYTVVNTGPTPVDVGRPPREGDYVFRQPTRVRPVPLVLWGILPNFQAFWLIDAVSQNQLIPPGHLVLLAFYTVAQVIAFLALAVILFQRRDVG